MDSFVESKMWAVRRETNMIRTIARYGVRHTAGITGKLVRTLFSKHIVQGDQLPEFEKRFAAYHGMRHAISASYGRMAF